MLTVEENEAIRNYGNASYETLAKVGLNKDELTMFKLAIRSIVALISQDEPETLVNINNQRLNRGCYDDYMSHKLESMTDPGYRNVYSITEYAEIVVEYAIHVIARR